jgi:hypothetical protein
MIRPITTSGYYQSKNWHLWRKDNTLWLGQELSPYRKDYWTTPYGLMTWRHDRVPAVVKELVMTLELAGQAGSGLGRKNMEDPTDFSYLSYPVYHITPAGVAYLAKRLHKLRTVSTLTETSAKGDLKR